MVLLEIANSVIVTTNQLNNIYVVSNHIVMLATTYRHAHIYNNSNNNNNENSNSNGNKKERLHWESNPEALVVFNS